MDEIRRRIAEQLCYLDNKHEAQLYWMGYLLAKLEDGVIIKEEYDTLQGWLESMTM